MDALPYTSPSLVTIMVLSSYLLLLSVFYHAFQRIFSAGILGPLVLGAIYARPLANILPQDVHSAILAIGYLGLILLIVQGGLEARMDILSSPRNLAVSVLVGATGVVLPIGISMALLPLGFGYGYLESFAWAQPWRLQVLGTTFAVLSSFNGSSAIETPPTFDTDTNNAAHGIAGTRIGTILIGAALLDDIIGLVIIGVIATLGPAAESQQEGSHSVTPWTIARPIVSSFLLLVISWLLSRFVLRPLVRLFAAWFKQSPEAHLAVQPHSPTQRLRRLQRIFTRFLDDSGSQQLLATTLLVTTVLAYSVIGEEIGSSLLIGAFCSGAMMKHVYSTFVDAAAMPREDTRSGQAQCWSPDYLLSASTSLGIVQETVLMPFFFSSIGSAIPVKSMFEGKTVWRGIIFAGLMAFAKVCVGGWIFVVDWIEQKVADGASRTSWHKQKQMTSTDQQAGLGDASASMEMQPEQTLAAQHSAEGQEDLAADSNSQTASIVQARQPVWPACLFLGTALMSRGEIGFLVINIASQGGLLDEQAFNVATWAIVLNTLAGPMSIGILMRTQHGQHIIRKRPHDRLYRWN